MSTAKKEYKRITVKSLVEMKQHLDVIEQVEGILKSHTYSFRH